MAKYFATFVSKTENVRQRTARVIQLAACRSHDFISFVGSIKGHPPWGAGFFCACVSRVHLGDADIGCLGSQRRRSFGSRHQFMCTSFSTIGLFPLDKRILSSGLASAKENRLPASLPGKSRGPVSGLSPVIIIVQNGPLGREMIKNLRTECRLHDCSVRADGDQARGRFCATSNGVAHPLAISR